MPLEIIRNDITKLEVDAIVNAANSSLLGGGGVDGAIHKAAGKGLLAKCKTLGGCKVGEAKLTKGYNLPAKYVIHTVGPRWCGGDNNEEQLLRNCYENSLEIARKHGFKTVAFPLISSGVYGYPKAQAFCVAVDSIRDFLFFEDDISVYLVLFDKRSLSETQALYDDINEYIDNNYAENHYELSLGQLDDLVPSYQISNDFECPAACFSSLKEAVSSLDESFSQMLIRLIDEKGMTDPECYKRAGVDRKLFSKIKNDIDYRPSKITAISFALALELDIEQTQDLLQKAGMTLSHSSKFDIIIEYFIVHKNYNMFEINEALFEFDQVLLNV